MTETALPRVLCVDDEPNVLAAMERNLFGEFDVVVAHSGEAGLDAVRWGKRFAVIMSDMRMPGMDGATFLAKAREISPDSVRILLTGQADVESSIAAINKGAIFRYLCKPCPKEELVAALNDAVGQYRLICAEKELLETTLTASVKTLTEVLAMVAPWAFQRSAFAQSCVRHALTKLEWPDGWIYTIAASLSQIGCVGIPADIVQADAAQRDLSEDEKKLLQEHPEVAGRLVENIPRLERVAEIIRHQAGAAPSNAPTEVIRGAHLLRAALELERHAARGLSLEHPREILRVARPAIPEYIIKALVDFRSNVAGTRTVRICELKPGWVVDEDIRTTNDLMVLTKGHELTDTAISALQHLLAANAVKEPIRVRGIPDTATSS
ncbi:response regulator [Dickeya dadantii]|uniref:Response regulator n=1 Tax=Dickeya dadantii (strain 3937) TaxID=198628 RepID=E0SBA4_DICD3|nr:HD domain-containing phosphohydrolase [Dickeya dadantii]ADM98373.1 Response regulator [Dickeya dadantii 3937]MCL6405554.1 response regulator [Dickeya dadantii]NPE49847.1 response regulator [Dickeya dadantii]NPE56117.1 response regulator [Dickeya dadantii]NPE60682.1 response regulator [Dickeya dadantii]